MNSIRGSQKRRRTWLTIGGAFAAAAVALGGVAIAQQAEAPSLVRPTGAAADDAPDGRYCASSIAIMTVFGSVCSNTCQSDVDCTVYGWGCKRGIEMGNGTTIGLCLPRRIPPTFR